jgi:hypothetical protein
VKEIVPKPAIAWVARVFYNENYVAMPMSHLCRFSDGGDLRVAYEWTLAGRSSRIEVAVSGEPTEAAPGSDEEFITEHYWGYARQRDGGTVEYQVEHPRWRVWAAKDSVFECDVERHYGATFASFLAVGPASAFLAEGSPVTVFKGTRLVLG